MREINEIKADHKNYFNLVKEMVIADFKLRYQSSVLGILWSLLQPMMLFGVLLFVFSKYAKFDIENYALHLLLGITLWNYFSQATTDSIKVLLRNAQIIKKIYFLRSSIVISVTVSSFLNFLVTLLVFFIIVLLSPINLGLPALLSVVFIFDLFISSLGISFLISTIGARFRDLQYIWPVFLRLGFWLTPIVYSVPMVPKKYHFFIYLNPITRIIQYSREALLQQKYSNLDGIVALNIVSVIIFVIGFYTFSKRSVYFPEEI